MSQQSFKSVKSERLSREQDQLLDNMVNLLINKKSIKEYEKLSNKHRSRSVHEKMNQSSQNSSIGSVVGSLAPTPRDRDVFSKILLNKSHIDAKEQTIESERSMPISHTDKK